jgi:hypothetical protein
MEAVDLTITVFPINYTAVWRVTLSFLKQRKKNACRRAMQVEDP